MDYLKLFSASRAAPDSHQEVILRNVLPAIIDDVQPLAFRRSRQSVLGES